MPLFEFGPNKSMKDGLQPYCKTCKREYDAARYKANPQLQKQASRRWMDNNKEHVSDVRKAWREQNKDRHDAQIRRWQAENKHRVQANTRNRQATKLKATPPWCDIEAIHAIYAEARRLELTDGIKRNVDHVIPLRNKMVCGLHVPSNMQILTEFENKSKNNRFTTDWG